MNAGDVITALRTSHYGPPAWGFIEQVAQGTGYSANRHLDAIAMSLYPSRGLEIHGIEVKVSKHDWIRELREPDKAEEVASRCDRFFVAAPLNVVDLFTMPPAWGLLVIDDKGKVSVAKKADKTPAKALDRGFVAAILRRVAELPSPSLTMQTEFRRQARDEARKDHDREVEYATSALRLELESLRDRVATFESASGIQITRAPSDDRWGFPTGEDIGKAVLYVARGGPAKVLREIETIERTLARITEHVDEARAQLAAPAPDIFEATG